MHHHTAAARLPPARAKGRSRPERPLSPRVKQKVWSFLVRSAWLLLGLAAVCLGHAATRASEAARAPGRAGGAAAVLSICQSRAATSQPRRPPRQICSPQCTPACTSPNAHDMSQPCHEMHRCIGRPRGNRFRTRSAPAHSWLGAVQCQVRAQRQQSAACFLSWFFILFGVSSGLICYRRLQ
jgi:hypothetical protein